MQIDLMVTPEEYQRCGRHNVRYIHMAYRLSPAGHLTRLAMPPQEHGGLLGLSDADFPAALPEGSAVKEILQECRMRRYGGVFAGFGGDYTPEKEQFLQSLAGQLRRQKLSLYLPPPYAAISQSRVLVSTAISGGELEPYLRQQQQCWGGRMVLDLQRLRMAFSLPCPSGQGQPLSQEEFSRLRQEGAPVFYSQALGARYFTRQQGERSSFILFDDRDTLRKKLRLGQALGIDRAILSYPEIRDLLPDLWRYLGMPGKNKDPDR